MQPNLLTIRPRAAHILSFFGPARGHNLFYFWAGLLLTLLILDTARPAFAQTTTTTSFTYNGTDADGTDGSAQTFTVPTGVTQLTVVAWGARGSGGAGRVNAVMSVTAGQVLDIYVGGSPNTGVRGPGSIQAGGFNGGGGASGLGNGGGGATDIRIGGQSCAGSWWWWWLWC